MELEVDRLKFTKEDEIAIKEFLEKENKISYYGREGIQKDYEESLANYLNKNFCLLTNSGTNALYSAFFSIKLKEEDEVLVQTQSFWASITPLLQLGVKPVLIESEKLSGNIDTEELKKKINKNSKAIVVTYFPGYSVNIEELVEIARENNLVIIEDISLCIGAQIGNTMLGSYGDIACFSLGSTKLLSGGQGGAMVCNNREYYERGVLLGHFGLRSFNDVMNPFYRQFTDVGYGMNNRMHVLSIAISKRRFENISSLIDMRKKRFELLLDYIDQIPFLNYPPQREDFDKGSWHGLYVFFSSNSISKEFYIKKMNEYGIPIFSGLHYPLLHQSRMFQIRQDGLYGLEENKHKYIYNPNDFPKAEEFASSLVSFPLFLDEPLEEIHELGRKLVEVSYKISENGE